MISTALSSKTSHNRNPRSGVTTYSLSFHYAFNVNFALEDPGVKMVRGTRDPVELALQS
jgi:hypothetical protein